jgi:AcrR family transcriptional regulator
MSIRNSAVKGGTAETGTADRLLDAARASILSVGWSRTTLTDVARRAGLSRMTIYRTYPDKSALFGDLMTREWAEVIEAVLAETPSDGGWPAVIADRVARIAAELRTNEVFRRIVDVDPELLLTYLLERRGRSQDALLEILAERIREAQAEGGVRDGDPGLLARTVLLTAHGFTLSGHTMADGTVTEADIDAQLVELIRRYLAP